MDKIVVVTGSSKGIGFEIANEFLSKGYKVCGLSRSKVVNDKIDSYQVDITNFEEVSKIFNDIYIKYGKIDIVVNNAGMGISGAIEYANNEDVKSIFDVNVLAVINVCKVAIPYLRKTQGKIINISSVAASISIPFQACYSATKSAIESFSLALANELRPQKIKVVCVRPGDTKTNFTFSRIKTEVVDEIYGQRIINSVKKMEKDEQNGVSPNKVANLVFKISTKKNPPLIITVGFGYKLVCLLSKILPSKFVNYIVYKLY